MAHLREAEPAEVMMLLRESHGVWGGTMSVDAYVEFNLAQLTTAWGRTHYRFLALGERSTAEVGLKFYTLQLIVAGRPYSVGGIGGVYALRSARGRGQGTALLRAVLLMAASEGLHLTQLFSDIGTAYYARLGFVTPPQRRDQLSWEWSGRPHGLDRPPGLTVRSATPDDLPTLVEVHRLHDARRRVSLDRDLHRWEHVLRRERLRSQLTNTPESEVAVAGFGASVDAYAIWKPEAAGLHWWEHGARPGMEALLDVLVGEAIRRTGRDRGTIRGLELPHGLIRPPCEPLRREPSRRAVMMLRGIHGALHTVVPPDVSFDTWHLDFY